MKKLVGGISKFVLAMVGSFLLMANVSYAAGWHDLTQPERDQKILAEARLERGSYGGQCIVWVHNVVRTASLKAWGPVVDIPWASDGGTGYTLAPDPNYLLISYGALDPYSMNVGMVIQMRIKQLGGGYIQHTAIVDANSRSTSQIVLVESNYHNDGMVAVRVVPYSWFIGPNSQIEPTNHYTVYEVR